MGSVTQEEFEYKELSDNGAVLGTLRGPCADILNATRNGRHYSDELWDKVFKNDIVKEYFANGGIPGELDHPVDGRLDTDTSKIAIMMREPPTRNGKGQLVGTFDILNTPNGRILKCLCDYGYKIGISSRGQGEVNEGFDGDEVDPDSYDFRAFDAVLLPAVKSARLDLVKESLENGKKPLRVALQEALDNAKPDERIIMQDTISKLKLNESEIKNRETIQSGAVADNAGTSVVKELQEALKTIREYDSKIRTLQEKLSACYTRDAKNREELSRYKNSIISLSESAKQAKALRSKISALTEQLACKDRTLALCQSKIEKLEEANRRNVSNKQFLQEAVESRDTSVKQLREQLADTRKQSAKELKALQENLAEVKQNAFIRDKENHEKLDKANKLVENYRKVAQKAVDRYIESRAVALGIKSTEIRNKLKEGYTFGDIDKACEELRDFKLRISSLPFAVDRPMKMKVTESVDPILPAVGYDDSIDADLLRLANL